MTRTRIALLSFAHTHAASYAADLAGRPDVELLCHDPAPWPAGERRGHALAGELGVAYADRLEDVLAWRPHAVVVTSENARHRELVEWAAAAGAHVLCEKPLATTEADGLAIQRAVEAAGVHLMMAFPVRFASSVARAKSLVDSGALGTLVAVRGANNGKLPTERGWFTDPALSGGGALVDHVVHLADVVEYLTDAAPVAVTAVSNRILHADRAAAETAGLVTVQYDTGLAVAIDCSWSRPDAAPTWGGVAFTLVGTEGAVDIDVFGPRARGIAADGRAVELPYGPDFDVALLDAFLRVVQHGDEPDPGLRSGLRTLRIVLAAQRAAADHDTVRLSGA